MVKILDFKRAKEVSLSSAAALDGVEHSELLEALIKSHADGSK